MAAESCLIVIDVQKGIFELKHSVFDADGLVSTLVTLIQEATRQRLKVVLTQHENRTFLVPGSDGWEIVDEVRNAAVNVLVVRKTKASIFCDTGLGDALMAEGIHRVFIAGLVSNGCLRDSCRDGLGRGFEVTLVTDAHSTFYKNARMIIDAVNAELAGRGVALVTAEAFTGQR